MNNKLSRNIKLLFQFIRLALISGTIFVSVLFVAGMVLTYLYREEAKRLIVDSLNQNLKTEIYVENIQLDLLRRLPKASLTFENVVVYEVSPHEVKDSLLLADKIYFQFSVFDLIRKGYKIERLEISGGRFAPIDHADGSNNYVFWEISDETPTDMEFDIQRVDLNDFEIDYKNKKLKSRYNIKLDRSRLSGKFAGDEYSLKVKSKMLVKKIITENSSFVPNQTAEIDLDVFVIENKKYIIDKGAVTLSDNFFEIAGVFENIDEGNFVDLSIKGKNVKLENLLNNLPQEYGRYFAEYKSRGEMYFDALIKGHATREENPSISAVFGVSNGTLVNDNIDLNIKELAFKAKYSNGHLKSLSSSNLVLEDFSAAVNNGKIQGSFSVHDFNEPFVKMNAKSDINVVDFINLIKIDNFKTLSGQIAFDINIESKIKYTKAEGFFKNNKIFDSGTTGRIKLKDINFTLYDDIKEYNDFNGMFYINNKDLAIRDFSGMVAENDFRMRGMLRNVLAYFFEENSRMVIDAAFFANNIKLDDLFMDSDEEADTTSYNLKFSDRVDFYLKTNIKNLRFGKFKASNLSGNLIMRNKKFRANDLSLNSMNGKLYGSAYVDGTNDDFFIMGSNANLENVDVNQMFYQFGNFGQTAILDENLKGSLTANLQFVSNWSSALEVDWNSLEATANITIENGEMINYEPMLALSRFIKVEDLEHVVFSKLNNEIQIHDSKIFIPDMEINSSAFNIKLSGTHNFENEIDYRLQVLLSELLAKKNRERRNPQEQYGDVIDDAQGRTTLHLALTGTTDNPIFRYDYQGVRERVREDFRQERKELRDILRDEFSWIRREQKDEPDEVLDSLQIEREKEAERIKEQEDDGFIIEFDDL